MFGQSGEWKDPYDHVAYILKYHYFLYFSIKETIRVDFATWSGEDDPGGF